MDPIATRICMPRRYTMTHADVMPTFSGPERLGG
jgi:hypothetical protein